MKKSVKLAAAGLAAMALVGGTFAYWQASSEIDNVFSTNEYGGQTTEVFNPLKGQDWEPGVEVEKKVGVKNTGDYDIVARIWFEETWERDGNKLTGYPMKSYLEENGMPKGERNMGFFPGLDTDATAENYSGSVVFKELAAFGEADNPWVDGRDGYFYTGIIKAGESTQSDLLKSVTLLPKTNMGSYEQGTTARITVKKGSEETIYENATMSVKSYEKNADNKWIDKETNEEVTFESEVEGNVYKEVVITGNKLGVDGKPESTLTTEKINAESGAVITQEIVNSLGNDKGYANAKYTLTIHTEFSQVKVEANGNVKALAWNEMIVPTTSATPALPSKPVSDNDGQ